VVKLPIPEARDTKVWLKVFVDLEDFLIVFSNPLV
jgi:hypothetical protein